MTPGAAPGASWRRFLAGATPQWPLVKLPKAKSSVPSATQAGPPPLGSTGNCRQVSYLHEGPHGAPGGTSGGSNRQRPRPIL